MASLILVRNVVGELRPKKTLAASRGFLAAARLSCLIQYFYIFLIAVLYVSAHLYSIWCLSRRNVVESFGLLYRFATNTSSCS